MAMFKKGSKEAKEYMASIRAKRGTNPRKRKVTKTAAKKPVVKRNPKGDVDTIAAKELVLYIENHAGLYRRQLEPIIKNLARKMNKGLYDKTKAIKLWGYLADSGAKEYNKEFGDGTLSLKMFDKPTRLFTAELLEKYFYEGVVEQNPRKTTAKKSTPRKTHFDIAAEFTKKYKTNCYIVTKVNSKTALAAFNKLNDAKEFAQLQADYDGKQYAIHEHKY